MELFSTKLPSPVGTLTLVASDQHLVAVLWPIEKPNRVRAMPTMEKPDHPVLTQACRQLEEYFAGQRREFDLPLAPCGTAFQKDVWQALQKIPFGETRSYGELAVTIGRHQASRAVGAANGRNPLSIVVPCHRVIGANGKLTGFAGGENAKAFLLQHERLHLGAV